MFHWELKITNYLLLDDLATPVIKKFLCKPPKVSKRISNCHWKGNAAFNKLPKRRGGGGEAIFLTRGSNFHLSLINIFPPWHLVHCGEWFSPVVIRHEMTTHANENRRRNAKGWKAPGRLGFSPRRWSDRWVRVDQGSGGEHNYGTEWRGKGSWHHKHKSS